MISKAELIKVKKRGLIEEDYIVALGIDQGYANLGYSIIKFNLIDNTYEIITSGTFTTNSNDSIEKRLLAIDNFLDNIIKEHNSIKIAGCERLFYNKPTVGSNFLQQRNKSASIMKTNMVTGIVYLSCARNNIKIDDFPPTTIKKYLTGSGKSDKKEVERAVGEIAINQGVNIKTDHEADAIAIAITSINNYIDILLNGKYVKAKKKDYIELNSRNHTLNKLYIKKYIVRLKEESDLRNTFLSKYSKEHKLRNNIKRRNENG